VTVAERYERIRRAIEQRCRVDISERLVVTDLIMRELARAEKAEARIAELNAFIVQLTRETPYPDEVRELAGQVRTLIAEVGTLRATIAEMKRRAPSFFGDIRL
jgi:hypothetical protein